MNHEIFTSEVKLIEYSSNGNLVAFACLDNFIRECYSFPINQIFEVEGHPINVHRLLFSNNGNYIITCSNDEYIRVFNVYTQGFDAKFTGNGRKINDIDISADDDTITTVGGDDKVYFINLCFQKCIVTNQFFEAVRQINYLYGDGKDELKQREIDLYDKSI